MANFRLPVTLVRSPTIMKLDSGSMISGSRPLNTANGRALAGGSRGSSAATAPAIARMWSGVVPQQPPSTLTNPSCAKSLSSCAVRSAGSSYSPIALGRPALG